MIDIVVLNYNDWNRTLQYVEDIKDYEIIDHIVVVDNNSDDDSFNQLQLIKNDKIFIIQSGKNGGYGFGNNFGVLFCHQEFNSKYVAITNPDVSYSEDCLKECILFLKEHEKDKYAVVAPLMKNINEVVVRSAWILPNWLTYTVAFLKGFNHFHRMEYVQTNGAEYATCDCVAGSMLIIDTHAFIDSGMYDENIFLYCEEIVLGFRLKTKGYRSALLGTVSFIHAHSQSINRSISNKLKQQHILWKSREYVLKAYYRINPFQQVIVKIVKQLSLLEFWLERKLRKDNN